MDRKQQSRESDPDLSEIVLAYLGGAASLATILGVWAQFRQGANDARERRVGQTRAKIAEKTELRRLLRGKAEQLVALTRRGLSLLETIAREEDQVGVALDAVTTALAGDLVGARVAVNGTAGVRTTSEGAGEIRRLREEVMVISQAKRFAMDQLSDFHDELLADVAFKEVERRALPVPSQLDMQFHIVGGINEQIAKSLWGSDWDLAEWLIRRSSDETRKAIQIEREFLEGVASIAKDLTKETGREHGMGAGHE